jgi:hypothetical protein
MKATCRRNDGFFHSVNALRFFPAVIEKTIWDRFEYSSS